MASLWQKIAGLFKPDTKEKGGFPNWTPLGGYPIYGHDAYGRKTPNPAELTQAFEDTVYACASLISDTVSSTPVRLYVKTGPSQARPKCTTRPITNKALTNLLRTKSLGRGYVVEEVCEHPALDLLNQANGYHNRIDLFGLTQLFLETTGNAFWLMKFDGYGIPVGLFLLPTQYIAPIRDNAGMVTAWRFGHGSNEVVYGTDEVIHFKFPSLDDPYGMGHAPLQAAWNRVQLQFKEMGFLDANLSNFGRPDAILAPDEPISPNEAERLAKDFLHRFKGQGAGGVFVADGPMKVTPISWPAKDFAELQLYQTIKNSVSNVFHIPPDIWELGEANRATAEAILYALAVHCIKPRMARFIEKLNERLIPFFDDRLFFEAEAIVPEDKQFELAEMQGLLSAGVLTRNEVRIQYGYEPREWANEPLLPPGSLPALALNEPEPPPVEQQPQDRSGQAPGLAQLQQAVYSGQLPREAAIANVQLTFGFRPEQAEALFPDVAPVRMTPDAGPQEGGGPGAEAPDPGQGQKALTPASALDVPDIRQAGDYDCGAAATMAVCRFYGVGPATEDEYIAALGTNEQDGTAPEAIVSYLGTVGLRADAGNDLEIADLAAHVQAGRPVIVCLQDYETTPAEIPDEQAGHYVVVCAADDQAVTLQDPSAGRVDMPTTDFLARWQDQGRAADYVHYGIAVSKGKKCGGEGGKPGPCPEGGADEHGGQAHQQLTQAVDSLGKEVNADPEAKEIAQTTFQKVKDKLTAIALDEFPKWALDTCDTWLFEEAMNVQGGTGSVLAVKAAAFGAAKAYLGIKKLFGKADNSGFDIARLHSLMTIIGEAGGLPVPSLDQLKDRANERLDSDKARCRNSNSSGCRRRHAAKPKKIKALRKKSPLPLAAALQRFFRKQQQELLSRVKAFDTKAFPPDNWFDIATWTKEMAEVMRPIIAVYYDYAAKQTAARIGASLDLLKVSQPKLQDGIDRATFLFCEETNKTTSMELGEAVKALKESLATGLEAGEVQNQLSKRVQGIFEQAEVARSYRIAVTEASRAQHSAQEITATESGLVSGKRWILSDDACPLCKPLAGKTVPLGQSFTTLPDAGPYADVQYPPLHPHCRCDMIEVVEGVND